MSPTAAPSFSPWRFGLRHYSVEITLVDCERNVSAHPIDVNHALKFIDQAVEDCGASCQRGCAADDHAITLMEATRRFFERWQDVFAVGNFKQRVYRDVRHACNSLAVVTNEIDDAEASAHACKLIERIDEKIAGKSGAHAINKTTAMDNTVADFENKIWERPARQRAGD